MGDMANYYMEQALLADWDGQHDEEPLTADSIWVTRDKQRISVRQMTDSHLLNTIRVLRGKSPIGTRFITDPVRRRAWLNVMANEVYARGLTLEEVDEKDPLHE